MKANILGLCFAVAFASGSIVKANDLKPKDHIYNVKQDTIKSGEYPYQADIVKGAVAKTVRQGDREKMLEQLSKKPADFPEAFSNAKEEYLWQEKAKADLAEYERHIKEINKTSTAKH